MCIKEKRDSRAHRMKAFVIGAVGVKLRSKGRIGGLREQALLLQSREDPCALHFNQLQASSGVTKAHKVVQNRFGHVLFLLPLQHKAVELLLQGFVAVVDAQLLEGVHEERFKPENVQNANKRQLRAGVPGLGELADAASATLAAAVAR